mmetsp:Transcript_24432/g.67534  ORF Transcript_24432/g.67534 Transcript_24432/m.67534 type:complete len:358 (-) Transcript_24432:84-1157(-)
MPRKKRGRPIPLAAPTLMTSRKRARKVTTMFHKLNTERGLALKEGDIEKVRACDKELEEMGGVTEYQRASQLSTSFHSTSKWVLGHLANNGWLYGIKTATPTTTKNASGKSKDNAAPESDTKRGKRRTTRRTTRILEVGAINTELLDAAAITASSSSTSSSSASRSNNNERDDPKTGASSSSSSLPNPSAKNNVDIHVRAIDIHSMEERIEEADFLELPLVHADPERRYDVIVCSMVLNCVTTPVDRGKMLALLYRQLRPGGLCFFTVPKYCLTKSAFLTHAVFRKMLGKSGVGFHVQKTKESPKVAFFVLERPMEDEPDRKLDPSFKKPIIRNKGKKFPNQFSVVLRASHIFQTEE